MAPPIKQEPKIPWTGVHEGKIPEKEFDGEAIGDVAKRLATSNYMMQYGKAIMDLGELMTTAQAAFLLKSNRMLTIIESEKVVMHLFEKIWSFKPPDLCHREKLPPVVPFDLNSACVYCKRKLIDVQVTVYPNNFQK